MKSTDIEASRFIWPDFVDSFWFSRYLSNHLFERFQSISFLCEIKFGNKQNGYFNLNKKKNEPFYKILDDKYIKKITKIKLWTF